MCSSEGFGQEHAHLPAVRALGADANDTMIWEFGRAITKGNAASISSNKDTVFVPLRTDATLMSVYVPIEHLQGIRPMLVVQIEKPESMTLATWFSELRL